MKEVIRLNSYDRNHQRYQLFLKWNGTNFSIVGIIGMNSLGFFDNDLGRFLCET